MNFKVGDRVAVYWWASSDHEMRVTGSVDRVDYKRVHVKVDANQGVTSGDFHPKQCRRLKKKEPVTYWVNEYVDGGFGDGVHKSKDSADLFCTRKVRAAILELRLVKRHEVGK